ncbi:MAG: bifunctional UDP-N-acetylglucosamine diphosphorylase/glucosamine-1-phosphate N-acetyltransferase GlmU [Cellvibrionaceae bacterium]
MLDIIILAAGKGTRMKSDLPKVLHPVGGRPLLTHVISAAQELEPKTKNNFHIVVGHGADKVANKVRASFDNSESINFIEQTEQLGTGHAVKQVLPHLNNDSVSLILYGDVPLIQQETLTRLIDQVDHNTLALLTVTLDDSTGYGRIIRNDSDAVTAIVEQKDALEEQLEIKEVNTGIMAVNSQQLQQWLPLLSNDNAQGEYYLTDIIAMAVAEGVLIATEQPQHEWEVMGINNRQQQAELERIYQYKQASQLMTDGVTLYDPNRFDCRGTLSCGTDVIIDVNCVFEGDNRIGNNVTIGPNCIFKNATIGNDTQINANSIIEDASLATACTIGPFARLRPGTELADNAKIGNFVETKKAIIGKGSKVNHLSYVGDAVLGKDVNVGAGTITCNYDGVNKHQTTIGDNVFVGSNTALVAPVTVEDGATIGAGSTINKDIEKDTLSLTRSPQKTFKEWQRPVKKK